MKLCFVEPKDLARYRLDEYDILVFTLPSYLFKSPKEIVSRYLGEYIHLQRFTSERIPEEIREAIKTDFGFDVLPILKLIYEGDGIGIFRFGYMVTGLIDEVRKSVEHFIGKPKRTKEFERGYPVSKVTGWQLFKLIETIASKDSRRYMLAKERELTNEDSDLLKNMFEILQNETFGAEADKLISKRAHKSKLLPSSKAYRVAKEQLRKRFVWEIDEEKYPKEELERLTQKALESQAIFERLENTHGNFLSPTFVAIYRYCVPFALNALQRYSNKVTVYDELGNPISTQELRLMTIDELSFYNLNTINETQWTQFTLDNLFKCYEPGRTLALALLADTPENMTNHNYYTKFGVIDKVRSAIKEARKSEEHSEKRNKPMSLLSKIHGKATTTFIRNALYINFSNALALHSKGYNIKPYLALLASSFYVVSRHMAFRTLWVSNQQGKPRPTLVFYERYLKPKCELNVVDVLTDMIEYSTASVDEKQKWKSLINSIDKNQ
jgi:hypothetical protein